MKKPKSCKSGMSEDDFESEVRYIAETRFKTKFSRDGTEPWFAGLYAEYKKAGSPSPAKNWITERLKNEFKSMTKPPVWADFDTSAWPFHNGKPMTFIAQIQLQNANKELFGGFFHGAFTYVFGAHDTGKYGEDVMVCKCQTLYKLR